jgi:hypothetical protein
MAWLARRELATAALGIRRFGTGPLRDVREHGLPGIAAVSPGWSYGQMLAEIVGQQRRTQAIWKDKYAQRAKAKTPLRLVKPGEALRAEVRHAGVASHSVLRPITPPQFGGIAIRAEWG